jgi:hypothetical protein
VAITRLTKNVSRRLGWAEGEDSAQHPSFQFPVPLCCEMSSGCLFSLIAKPEGLLIFFQDRDSFIGILILKVPHVCR